MSAINEQKFNLYDQFHLNHLIIIFIYVLKPRLKNTAVN